MISIRPSFDSPLISISELRNHPPFPLTSEQIRAYETILYHITFRKSIVIPDIESARSLLNDHNNRKSLHIIYQPTNSHFRCTQYTVAIAQAKETLITSETALRKLNILIKEIEKILKQNKLFSLQQTS